MRKTLTTALLGIFGVTAAATAQPVDTDTVRTVSRVVVEQQRPQPRVLVRGRDAGREEQSETLKRTVKIGNNGELEITNIAGNIDIKRGGGNEATIDIVKVARGRTAEEARAQLPLVNIEVTERGSRAEIRTVYPGGKEFYGPRRNLHVAVHYTITAPAGTRITARSLSGSIRASDMNGDLSLVTTSGDVQVLKAKRVSAAKTTSGTVELADVDNDVPVEAASVSGNVMVHRVKAPRMELSTVSGKVVMQDVAADRIEAQSLSGDVEFGGGLKKAGRYEFNSHSGNVKVAVGGGSGFELEANSWSGNVRSEVEVSGGGVQPATGHRMPRRKELKGVVGDGSAILKITTFSGNVLITKR